jgi:exopolysaccharide biosynthesis polyprenyl glycosylphosphotransferase
MRDSRQVALRRVTLFLDCFVLPLSAALAFFIHGVLKEHLPGLKAPPQVSEYAVILYAAIPVWLALDVMIGLHRAFEHRWTRFGLFIDLLKLHGIGFLAIASLLFLTQIVINRAIVFAFLGVNMVVMFIMRSIVGSTVEARYERGQNRESLLLVGDPSPLMTAFVDGVAAEEFAPSIAGVLSNVAVPANLKNLGVPQQLGDVLHDAHVDLVVFFPPFQHPESAAELLKTCERIGVSTAFVVTGAAPYSVAPQVLTLGNVPCLTFDWVPARSGALAVKYSFDAFVAVVGLIVLSPLLLVVALLIRITMGSPVLFKQERVGLHGRRFNLIKFRTMVHDAENKRAELLAKNEMSGPVFKIAEDPRITPLGRFLRKWSIDELPQLINVALGQMSLVGPRPLPVAEQQEIEGWYRRRLSMKPGITGLWQVSGRNDVDFDEWMQMDLRYVDQWTLRLDLQLLQRTVPAVLLRKGAR